MGETKMKERLRPPDYGTPPPWSGTYTTLDNGGDAFKVVLRGKTVDISRCVYDEKSSAYSITKCVSLRPERVFVGRSPLTKMTRFSGGHGPKFDGNSMLLAFANNRYVHVGTSILGFQTHAPISWFVSPVGNSGVPYPFMVDLDGCIIMPSHEKVEHVLQPPYPADILDFNSDQDPSDYAYNLSLMTPDRSRYDRHGKPNPVMPILDVPALLDITAYYVGKEMYTMR